MVEIPGKLVAVSTEKLESGMTNDLILVVQYFVLPAIVVSLYIKISEMEIRNKGKKKS